MTNYIKAEGFDSAIIGIDTNQERIIYSKQQMIDILVLAGLSIDESIEYLEHNTWNSSTGNNVPIYLHPITNEALIELLY
jgi:aminopeptidase C